VVHCDRHGSWIDRAHESRKKLEPAVVKAMRKLTRLRLQRPGAKVTIKATDKELRGTLKKWELAYRNEFYNGLRVLMELQRNGASHR